MIILTAYKSLRKLNGLNPLGGVENMIWRFTYLFSLFSSSSMLLISFIDTMDEDLYLALGSLPACIAYSLHGTTYVDMLRGREDVYSLLDELQDVVNKSVKNKLISD